MSYKDRSDEQLDNMDQDIIAEYMNQLDIDTPNLWNRIEAGLDAVDQDRASHAVNIDASYPNEKRTSVRRKNKMVIPVVSGLLVAAVLGAVIFASPIINGLFSRVSSNMAVKSEDRNDREFSMNGVTGDASPDKAEEVSMDIEQQASDSVSKNTISGSELQAEDCEDVNDMETAENVVMDAIAVTLNISEAEGEMDMEGSSYIVKARVESIATNSHGIYEGDEITVIMKGEAATGKVTGELCGFDNVSGAWIFEKN